MAAISRFELLEQLHPNAFTFHRGIEREALRVDAQGELSQKHHPEGLGSALTHGSITTDYSESLLEFITGVHTDKASLLNELDELHRFAYAELEGETFWPSSMPSKLPDQEQIPIAQYGDSHVGRLKTIYRHGLWHRYGRKMQTIAGLHFNWSLSEEFWRQWALLNGKTGDLTQFKTDEYFGLIRSFRRHSWLLLYLFGASPAADETFVDEPVDSLSRFGDGTLYGPYATSLRMSDLGYSNKAQAELFVCFNSLETYAKTLSDAINQPYPAYDQIGLKSGDSYQQLNTNILQIENEYYSDIRPKRVAYSGEKPLHALRNRGVEYIEVRCLDVNPFTPLGIDATQIDFLDLFLLWCLVQDHPQITEQECQLLQINSQNVAINGRDPALTITQNGHDIPLLELAETLMQSLNAFGRVMDAINGDDCYQTAVSDQKKKLNDPELLPSSRVFKEIQKTNSFSQFNLDQATMFAEHFGQALSSDQQAYWTAQAELSWQSQKDIESADQGSFDSFLADYLRQ